MITKLPKNPTEISQQYIYILLKKYILNIEGIPVKFTNDIIHNMISKEQLMDGVIELLNEFESEEK